MSKYDVGLMRGCGLPWRGLLVSLLTLSACKPVVAPTLPVAISGEQVFMACLQCHSPDAINRPTGPNLHGLFGRKAATSDGYFYSEPLRNAGIVWNAATLDAFLTDPQKVVPNSFMLAGVPNINERKALIDYLQTLR